MQILGSCSVQFLTVPQPSTRRLIEWIPASLIALRVALGPVVLVCAVSRANPWGIFVLLVVAMLSDIYDGVIARRLGIATERLRVADSRADAWFFACIALSVWFADGDVVRRYAVPITIEIVQQIGSYMYDLVRYRRITSLHAYSAKVWGVSLYLATGGILLFHFGGLIWLSFGLGLVSFFDALAIKLILPGWQHDVLSCVHAWKARNATAA